MVSRRSQHQRAALGSLGRDTVMGPGQWQEPAVERGPSHSHYSATDLMAKGFPGLART